MRDHALRVAAGVLGAILIGGVVAGARAKAPGPGGAAHAAAAPATPAARIRIATWNIAWLARRSGDGPVPRRAADYRRLATVAARLDADVVALQEIDGVEAA